jgi:hypothetical protein
MVAFSSLALCWRDFSPDLDLAENLFPYLGAIAGEWNAGIPLTVQSSALFDEFCIWRSVAIWQQSL